MEAVEQYETVGGEIEDRVALACAVSKYVRARQELDAAMNEHQTAKEELMRLMPNQAFVTEHQWKTYLVTPEPFMVREIEKL